MPRHARLHGPDAWYHVFNRGTDRQDIFHTDADRIAFEQLVAAATEHDGLEIHAIALMTNHFHLLVHSPEDTTSAAMHRICGTYAARYNRLYERTGPLMSGRFRSVLVSSDEQLLTASRYIHRNPLALVDAPALAAYRWSSFGAYVGARPAPTWLTTDVVLGLWGGSSPEVRMAGYRRFVEEPAAGDDREWFATSAADGDTIEWVVARIAGVPVEALHASRRHVENRPRLLAMLVMQQRRVATAQELADRFGLTSQSGARSATSRARALLASDPDFRRLWVAVTGALDRATANTGRMGTVPERPLLAG